MSDLVFFWIFLQPTTYIISVKKPNRVKLLISCGADIGVKNSEGLSALYFINKNVPECMKNFEQRLDTGVSLSQSRDERRIELSMNLREVSQCLVPTSVFSLLKASTSAFIESIKSLSQPFLHVLIMLNCPFSIV